MSKKFGFTLAEVLITLGIIGVVAAMTMPTLMSNTQGAQFKTAFKKELSTLNQAVLMQFAMDDTDFSNIVAESSTASGALKMSSILTSRLQAATDITTSYFAAKPSVSFEGLNVNHTCVAADVGQIDGCTAANVVVSVEAAALTSSNALVYSFADGTSFGYNKNAANCTTATSDNCYGFLDVNGVTKPNDITKCPSVENDSKTVCEASDIHDIFPVRFYGQTVEAATKSGRAVLTNK